MSKIFLSSVVQKYAYIIEFIFNIIRGIVMNTVKYRFHVFKIIKINVIFASGRSFS